MSDKKKITHFFKIQAPNLDQAVTNPSLHKSYRPTRLPQPHQLSLLRQLYCCHHQWEKHGFTQMMLICKVPIPLRLVVSTLWCMPIIISLWQLIFLSLYSWKLLNLYLTFTLPFFFLCHPLWDHDGRVVFWNLVSIFQNFETYGHLDKLCCCLVF